MRVGQVWIGTSAPPGTGSDQAIRAVASSLNSMRDKGPVNAAEGAADLDGHVDDRAAAIGSDGHEGRNDTEGGVGDVGHRRNGESQHCRRQSGHAEETVH